MRLRELRQAKGMTQVELAEHTGIDQGALSRIENGKTQAMDFDVMARVCDALGCEPEDPIELKRKRRR